MRCVGHGHEALVERSRGGAYLFNAYGAQMLGFRLNQRRPPDIRHKFASAGGVLAIGAGRRVRFWDMPMRPPG